RANSGGGVACKPAVEGPVLFEQRAVEEARVGGCVVVIGSNGCSRNRHRGPPSFSCARSTSRLLIRSPASTPCFSMILSWPRPRPAIMRSRTSEFFEPLFIFFRVFLYPSQLAFCNRGKYMLSK